MNKLSTPITFLRLFLILLAGSLAACESRSTQPGPAAETAPSMPPTATPTITPTPMLNLAAAAARACQLQAIPQAVEYVSNSGTEHKIYIIGADGFVHAWNEDLAENIKAGSVEELEAVMCLGDQSVFKTTSSCGMYRDSITNTSIEVYQGQYSLDLKMVAAKTGEIIASGTILSNLRDCPEIIQSNDYNLVNGVYYGDVISWETVWNNWDQRFHQAIANPTGTPTPTVMPTTTPLPPGPSVADWSVELKEDFSESDFMGWELSPGETIADGILTWQLPPNQSIYQKKAHQGTSFTYDVYARLVVRHTSGSVYDAYGLAFRMKNENELLAFLIQDDGSFRIQTGDIWDYSLESSPYILPGDWNTLEVIDLQGEIYLSINGVVVAQIYQDPSWGQAGLAVAVEGNPDSAAGSTFEFDEFEVRVP